MSARWIAPFALAAFAFAASGCGEKPQVTVYKQGTYQGKPDNRPWQSQPFNGSQRDWEKAIDGRTRYQNEYARIENQ
jgi:hypothetical protein